MGKEVGKKLLKGVPVSGIANEHDWAAGGFYLNENPNSVSMEVDLNVKLKPELLVPTSGSQLFHAAPYVQLQIKKYNYSNRIKRFQLNCSKYEMSRKRVDCGFNRI